MEHEYGQEYELVEDGESAEPCHECEYYRELIEIANLELTRLRKQIEQIEANNQSAHPEKYAQVYADEDQTRLDLKQVVLARTAHQRSAHVA